VGELPVGIGLARDGQLLVIGSDQLETVRLDSLP
jgi:hypothetical protein